MTPPIIEKLSQVMMPELFGLETKLRRVTHADCKVVAEVVGIADGIKAGTIAMLLVSGL